MKKLLVLAATAALLAAPAAPALAGWKLVEKDQPVTVAKGTMSVRPDAQWNRWSTRPIKTSEIWTIDGTELNELYFVDGLGAGGTLFKDARKKDAPLPALSAKAELSDIPEFVESSVRVALNTSAFEMGKVEPATLGGQPAVRFGYEYAVEGVPLKRRGLAVGTLVGGKLRLITYTAPTLYYFDRDLAKAEAVFASATL